MFDKHNEQTRCSTKTFGGSMKTDWISSIKRDKEEAKLLNIDNFGRYVA